MQNTHSRPSIIRRLYDWVLHWANTPYGLTALVIISFAESSFFPIPPDVLLVALVLSAPHRWRLIAASCTAASVVGGLMGYGIGWFAWDTVGQWIVTNIVKIDLIEVNGRLDIALPSYLMTIMGEQLGGSHVFEVYDRWNAWIVGIFGLTPLPYKLVTVTAGVAQVNLISFTIASCLARGLRFFAVAFILYKVGEPAKDIIDKHFNLITIVFSVLLIGSFLLIGLAF